MSEAAFEGSVSDGFADYAFYLRGYIRYQQVRMNLAPFVMGKSLRVADIGGGSAIDAAWLAGEGHTVDVVEPADAQLKKATERVAALPAEVGRRIQLRQAKTDDLLAEGQVNSYDLVLSHGVAMYLDDPKGFIGQLVDLAKPGGHVSLLEKGFHATEMRLLQAQKWDEARRFGRTHRTVNRRGLEVQAFLPEELTRMLKAAGAKVVKWSGVRAVSDVVNERVEELTETDLKTILDIEDRQGHRPDTRGHGQMLHFIAQKPA